MGIPVKSHHAQIQETHHHGQVYLVEAENNHLDQRNLSDSHTRPFPRIPIRALPRATLAQGFAIRLVGLRQGDLPAAIRNLAHRAECVSQEVFRAARAALR